MVQERRLPLTPHRGLELDEHFSPQTASLIKSMGNRSDLRVMKPETRMVPRGPSHAIGPHSCGFHGGPEPLRSTSEAGDTFAVQPLHRRTRRSRAQLAPEKAYELGVGVTLLLTEESRYALFCSPYGISGNWREDRKTVAI